jgi:hypothetical protein
MTDIPKVDSAEGIAELFHWARGNRMVFDPEHERIARKYGVDTSGVVIARKIPATTPRASIYKTIFR